MRLDSDVIDVVAGAVVIDGNGKIAAADGAVDGNAKGALACGLFVARFPADSYLGVADFEGVGLRIAAAGPGSNGPPYDFGLPFGGVFAMAGDGKHG